MAKETEQVRRGLEAQPILVLEDGRAEKYLNGLKEFADSKTRGVDYKNEDLARVEKGKKGRWKLTKEGRKMAAEELLGIFRSEEVKQTGKLDVVNTAMDMRLEEINQNIQKSEEGEEKEYWKLVANSLRRRTKKVKILVMVDIVAKKGTNLGKVINTIEQCKGPRVTEEMADGLWEFHMRRKSVASVFGDEDPQKGYFLKRIDEKVADAVGDWWNGHNKEEVNFKDLIPEALAEKQMGNNSGLRRNIDRTKWLNDVWYNLVSGAEREMVKVEYPQETNRGLEVEAVEKPKHLSWGKRAEVAAIATVVESTAAGLVYLATTIW